MFRMFMSFVLLSVLTVSGFSQGLGDPIPPEFPSSRFPFTLPPGLFEENDPRHPDVFNLAPCDSATIRSNYALYYNLSKNKVNKIKLLMPAVFGLHVGIEGEQQYPSHGVHDYKSLQVLYDEYIVKYNALCEQGKLDYDAQYLPGLSSSADLTTRYNAILENYLLQPTANGLYPISIWLNSFEQTYTYIATELSKTPPGCASINIWLISSYNASASALEDIEDLLTDVRALRQGLCLALEWMDEYEGCDGFDPIIP